MSKKRAAKKTVTQDTVLAEEHPSDIVLSSPIDLSIGVSLKKVLAYITRRHMRAQAGDSEAMMDLLHIARTATHGLAQVTEDRPTILKGKLPPKNFPILVPTKKWPSKLFTLFDARAPSKTRSDASQKVTTYMKRFADDLYERWKKTWNPDEVEDDFKPKSIPFSLIISVSGWQHGNSADSVMKGIDEAVKFLPPPSNLSCSIWWELAEAILRNEYGEAWFLDIEILRRAGKDPNRDALNARGNVDLQYKKAFKQAVRRLAARPMQPKTCDDK